MGTGYLDVISHLFPSHTTCSPADPRITALDSDKLVFTAISSFFLSGNFNSALLIRRVPLSDELAFYSTERKGERK